MTETTLLYGGEIELNFSAGNHRYTINDQPVQGVTSILRTVIAKDGLMFWSAKMVVENIKESCDQDEDDNYVVSEEALQRAKSHHVFKKERGGDVGTIVHNWIEQYVKGKLSEEKGSLTLPADPEARLGVEAFLRWEQENKVKFLFSERVVYSKKYHYCGTADIAFEIDGKKYLGDFKTANPRSDYKRSRYTGLVAPYADHLLQIAAYDIAYSEETGEEFDAHMVIYIPKTGQLYPFETKEIKQNKEAFINALKLSNRLGEMDAFAPTLTKQKEVTSVRV